MRTTYEPIDLFLRRFKQGNTLLLTRGNLAALVKNRDLVGKDDPTAIVKFFDPCGSWTWYATEATLIYVGGEIEDVEFFGLVDGLDQELGRFTLRELRIARGYSAQRSGPRSFRMTIPIERDIHWTPRPLSEVRGA